MSALAAEHYLEFVMVMNDISPRKTGACPRHFAYSTFDLSYAFIPIEIYNARPRSGMLGKSEKATNRRDYNNSGAVFIVT
jgi:hypothetical protein